MFVSRARFEQMRRLYEGQTARRQAAEDKLTQQATVIERLKAQISQEQDEHPSIPVSVQPATGAARLVQRLNLSERARTALDEQLLTLHWTTVQQEREILQLRDQLTEEQAVSESLARQIQDMVETRGVAS